VKSSERTVPCTPQYKTRPFSKLFPPQDNKFLNQNGPMPLVIIMSMSYGIMNQRVITLSWHPGVILFMNAFSTSAAFEPSKYALAFTDSLFIRKFRVPAWLSASLAGSSRSLHGGGFKGCRRRVLSQRREG
jgi:hypothetical protein